MPLTTRFVDVLISVTELLRIDENASGMSSFDGLIFARRATPKTIGTKNAVDAVLLMNAPRPADAIMTTICKRRGAIAGMTHDRTADEIHHAGAHQRRGQDQQPEDHDHRVAAETGERFVRRQDSGQHHHDQQTERGDIRLDPFGGEKHQRDEDEEEKQADCERHRKHIGGQDDGSRLSLRKLRRGGLRRSV